MRISVQLLKFRITHRRNEEPLTEHTKTYLVKYLIILLMLIIDVDDNKVIKKKIVSFVHEDLSPLWWGGDNCT